MSNALHQLDLYEVLRTTYADHENYRKAALELLIWHDYWLKNKTFSELAILEKGENVYISWPQLEESFNNGQFDYASTSQRAVLALAIDLALDRYRFAIMGDAHRAAILEAFTKALS